MVNRAEYRDIRESFERWASCANKESDGWETDYPEWSQLSKMCRRLMTQYTEGDLDSYEFIEFCWRVAEEDEEFAEFAKKNPTQCLSIVLALVTSEFKDVRWQAYDSLGTMAQSFVETLRAGMKDSDSYVRRRAAIAYARTRPISSERIVDQLIADPDAYIRQSSLSYLPSLGEQSAKDLVTRLAGDAVEHVRKKAQEEGRIFAR